MKAAVALGMALTMTVTGASAVFAEGETLSVATDFEIKTLVPWAASEENAFLVLNQAEEGLFRMDVIPRSFNTSSRHTFIAINHFLSLLQIAPY